jgi:hypothetical protein
MNWKKIEDYPYEVDAHGHIRNCESGKLLSTISLNGGGYNYVTLFNSDGRRNFMIHRLVATTFIDNPDNKPQVNHIDGNKRNNHVSNLEWMTQFENMRHAVNANLSPKGETSYLAKLKEEDILKIRLAAESGIKRSELVKMYKVNSGAISGILLGRTWKHVGGPLQQPQSKNKLSPDDIPIIRYMFKEGKTDLEIGNIFGVARGNIQQIRSGKNWKNY